MKTKHITAIIALLLAIGGYYIAKHKPDGFVHPKPAEGCNESLWNHIYHPQRLTIVEKCTSITGILESAKAEPDGDYHIRLKLDPEFANLINAKNTSGQKGDLVLEPVCENPVTQKDAVASCQNFIGNIIVPKPGSHISVLGSYVLDTEHGWMEIHPVTSLTILNH